MMIMMMMMMCVCVCVCVCAVCVDASRRRLSQPGDVGRAYLWHVGGRRGVRPQLPVHVRVLSPILSQLRRTDRCDKLLYRAHATLLPFARFIDWLIRIVWSIYSSIVINRRGLRAFQALTDVNTRKAHYMPHHFFLRVCHAENDRPHRIRCIDDYYNTVRVGVACSTFYSRPVTWHELQGRLLHANDGANAPWRK